jgi:hypothetical protein
MGPARLEESKRSCLACKRDIDATPSDRNTCLQACTRDPWDSFFWLYWDERDDCNLAFAFFDSRLHVRQRRAPAGSIYEFSRLYGCPRGQATSAELG